MRFGNQIIEKRMETLLAILFTFIRLLRQMLANRLFPQKRIQGGVYHGFGGLVAPGGEDLHALLGFGCEDKCHGDCIIPPARQLRMRRITTYFLTKPAYVRTMAL